MVGPVHGDDSGEGRPNLLSQMAYMILLSGEERARYTGQPREIPK